MNATPTQALAAYLIAQGLGVKPSASKPPWTITVGRMPAELPDDRITIYDTGGNYDGREHKGGRSVVHPVVQIRVRSIDYLTGYQKAVAIQAALDQIKMTSVTVGTENVVIAAATITIPLVHIGQEEQSDRELFTINAQLTFGGS